MPLFEFDAGQLVPAQVGHAVTDPVQPAVLDAVRAQVLEILRLPLFPVTWQDDDGAPRLTAMDATGQVVSVEVHELLDAAALVGALGRAGRSAEQGWLDVARSYPRGVGAFRRDWNAFREAQPAGTTVAARVHIIAAHIDDDARQALDALAGAGVVVHELVVRAMSSGRLFVDVTELSVPVAPLPWLLPGRTPAAIEQGPEPVALGDSPDDAPAVPATQREATPGEETSEEAAPAARGEATPDETTPDEDLRSICADLQEPAPLVWVHNGRRGEATLRPDGWIVVGGRPFPAPEEAASAVAGGRVTGDAWSAWRFGEHGPSLHEAREELRAHRARPRNRSGGLRRRERRRRAASE